MYKFKCPICGNAAVSCIETIVTNLIIMYDKTVFADNNLDPYKTTEYTCNRCRYTDKDINVFIEEN